MPEPLAIDEDGRQLGGFSVVTLTLVGWRGLSVRQWSFSYLYDIYYTSLCIVYFLIATTTAATIRISCILVERAFDIPCISPDKTCIYDI